ncbi:F-box domain containing protein [Parasponia andersonii]|uniref:F-box domain containing protein n=1 Tax=Parasponia andersonii TaxID=3476 RepID=A0A2P5E5C2_PARAD|nr:F-box domain containing protein [Parasponia andersonii]
MQQKGVKQADRNDTKRHAFNLNDHIDILIEVLKRLDGASLGVAACVCRLWCALACNDSLWEHLCFRHVSSPPPPSVRPVVVALGGYKRLYMVCVRPVLSRLGGDSGVLRRRVWTRDEVQLSLSLFCIDYYERLGKLGGGAGGGDASASSLMFLCNPVNV